MADDSPFPPNDAPAEAPKPRGGIANLLPPCKPGEVRNKYGRNGRDKNKIIVDFMEEVDPRDKRNRTRIRAFLETVYLRALAGNGVAIKYLGEQYAGKAHSRVDLSNEDGSLRASVFAYIPDNGRGPRAEVKQQEQSELDGNRDGGDDH